MSDPYTIVSADCHAGLACEDYRQYLDSRHHEQFDQFLLEREEHRKNVVELNYDYIMEWETSNEEGLRGAYDPVQRDKELDADHVAGEVIFPDADSITGSSAPPFGAGLNLGTIDDPELAFAGARAHNRFLADLCSHAPHRRAGVAIVPITHSVERAVEEIEWVASQPGIRGIMIPTLWRHHAPYNDPVYDPVWAACASNGLVVHTHSGDAPQDEFGERIGIFLAEVVWWATRPMWHLLFSGAFERHPDLRFVVTEAGAYWASDMMWKWDTYFGGGHTTKKMAAQIEGTISRLPSDYFGSNIFIGASTMPKEEIRRRHVIGTDVIMWGNDYPHPEGTWPHTIDRLKRDFAHVPIGEARKMLGENTIRCYQMDSPELRAEGERLGLTPEDLGQDPDLGTEVTTDEARWWKAEYGLKAPGR